MGNVSEPLLLDYIVDNTAPPAPDAVTVTLKNGTAKLCWQMADTPDLFRYRIYRRLENEDCQCIGTAEKTDTVYVDKNIQADRIYTYYITAIDQAGNSSAPSVECEVSTKEDTEPPTKPEAFICTGSSICLRWNPSTDNIGIAGYRIYRNGVCMDTCTGTEYEDTGLQTSKFYTYEVTAIDEKGNESPKSETCSAGTVLPAITGITPSDYQTLGGERTSLVIAWDGYCPGTEYQVTVNQQQAVIGLSWDASISADTEGYYLYRKTSRQTDWELIVDVKKDQTGYTDRSVTEDESYQYAVAAYDTFLHVSEKTESVWIQAEADRTPPEIICVAAGEEPLHGTAMFTVTGSGVSATAVTNRLGQTAVTTYDANGNPLSETDEAGNTVRYTYDENGNQTGIKDAAGNRTAVIRQDGSRETKTYDALGRVTSLTNTSGGVTRYTYDALGNVSTITDPAGRVTTYRYNAIGWLTSVTEPDGASLTYETNAEGLITSVTDSLGRSTRYTYDAVGNLQTQTDAMGNTTGYTYDAGGNVTSITTDGKTSCREYYPNGKIAKETDASGIETIYTYDQSWRLSSVTRQTGEAVSYAYDSCGNLISQTDALGETTRMVYDSLGRLSELIQADGSRYRFTCDSADNITSVTDPAGNTISYSYDSQNRCIAVCDGYGTLVEQTAYNHAGAVTQTTDALGNITYTGYDSEGQAVSMTQTSGEEEHHAFYSYDNAGRILSTLDAADNPVTLTYDTQGNITGMTTAGGHTTTYTYDLLGRVTSRTDDIGTTTYTYDKNSNVLTVEENGAVIVRTYDALNRVTSCTDYAGRTIRYAYDEVGNLISLTYPGGEIVRYSYNPDRTLAAVTDADGTVTRYQYDSNARLISITRPDGSRERKTYDAAGRLTGQQDTAADGTILQDYSYAYDGYDRITATTGLTPDPEAAAIIKDSDREYNEAGQLIRFNGQTIRYDKNGNMTYGPLNGKMTAFHYDCRNRLIKAGGITLHLRCRRQPHCRSRKRYHHRIPDRHQTRAQPGIMRIPEPAADKKIYLRKRTAYPPDRRSTGKPVLPLRQPGLHPRHNRPDRSHQKHVQLQHIRKTPER